MALPIGTPAPQFTLLTKTAAGLEARSLSDLAGKSLVLLFFPAAFTGVCTDEMCDMTAGMGDYNKLNADIWGVSCDSAFAQEAWAKQNNIGVTLLSDYDKKVCELFDVVLPDLVGLGKSSKRAAFVIDGAGVIRYSEETANPGVLPNFEAVVETLRSL